MSVVRADLSTALVCGHVGWRVGRVPKVGRVGRVFEIPYRVAMVYALLFPCSFFAVTSGSLNG